MSAISLPSDRPAAQQTPQPPLTPHASKTPRRPGPGATEPSARSAPGTPAPSRGRTVAIAALALLTAVAWGLGITLLVTGGPHSSQPPVSVRHAPGR